MKLWNMAQRAKIQKKIRNTNGYYFIGQLRPDGSLSGFYGLSTDESKRIIIDCPTIIGYKVFNKTENGIKRRYIIELRG